ncbi:MAG: ATP-binding cassette domain-containing protein [Clostridiales bacterium]|nr:ATP-binding cassette domain-containing protein [Clostridiales bacterium]
MILKLDNIYYKYEKNLPYILNGISYEFEKGKFYAVTGGSGSGKTTLISIIAALAKPSDGKIYYDGVDITKIDEDKYRANYVSIIFQNYNLLYNYTAIDNITTALHISGYTGDYTARADALLDEVSIPVTKRKYVVQNLSGGEQQRVAIARALAADSRVILADEPTGNLDEENKNNIINILRASLKTSCNIRPNMI